jgi:hypothetical protein
MGSTRTRILNTSALYMAKERAQEIQRAQERALSHLPPESLHVALWLRNDPPPLNDFHWAFYYHEGPKGGTIYQVKGLSEGWITDHGVTGCIFKSLFLCCLVQIGNISSTKKQELDQTIRSCDSTLNEICDVTCKVWLFEVLPRLIEQGFVRCDNPEALKAECLAIGNKFRVEASGNVQPRPAKIANTCSC